LLVLLGLAAFWLWRRLRREDDSSPRRSVIIPRLPHEEAYDALDRLEASDLLQRAEIKQYHIRVSEIIRTYVEGRFDVFALEMTTGEVMEGLREAGLDDDVLVAFDEFLRGCDLVKFAKHRPPPEACRQAMAAARELVDRTRGRVEDLADPPMPAAGGSPDGDGSSDGDGSHDENGGPDAGGSGSPDGPDDPRGSGASILETAGAEGA